MAKRVTDVVGGDLADGEVVDGNEAAARVAYLASEVVAIYPITPSSTMGELCDAWSVEGRPNAWGSVPSVMEMQSEGGAAGAVHGALQAGSLTTTFTSSQGLLLMLPDMFKIAGELTPCVFHIAARAVATHALSIFGDHSDVMAVRSAGWATLFSSSVQEAADLALVAHAATLTTRIPFMHAFDGFRTSHEVAKVHVPDAADVRALIDEGELLAHRARALSPDHPVLRGSAQNPDVFFQGREGSNLLYAAVPDRVQSAMDALARRTGRQYHLFEYVGDPDAELVIVVMGSAVETVEHTVRALVARGQPVGVIRVRLFRPFSIPRFLAALPRSTRVLAVMDRCKEPGATAEPLHLDVVTAITEGCEGPYGGHTFPRIIGGRYGLGSKELTPAMVKGLFDEMGRLSPRPRFTLGIEDDVTHLSIEPDETMVLEGADERRAVFWGLGSDGTVSSVKGTLHILGEHAGRHVQGYFVYDSKKAGAVTVSHVRFGREPIQRPWLIDGADIVAVHHFPLLAHDEVLAGAAPGATILVNSRHADTWSALPAPARRRIVERGLKLWAVDASAVARAAGLGRHVNTVMQACFFALADVLPREEALVRIRDSITRAWGRRDAVTMARNLAAVDLALAGLHAVPAGAVEERAPREGVRSWSFIDRVTQPLIAGKGEQLRVSALPPDGTFPTGTAALEKRDFADAVPEWNEDLCIECGKCLFVCPHAAIRAKAVDAAALADAPLGVRSIAGRFKELGDTRYVLQVSTMDCTGCRLCVEVCPAVDKKDRERKALAMRPHAGGTPAEREAWGFFLDLPEQARTAPLGWAQVKNLQLLQPLFEFSGACSGCGETPYLKLVSQLFGDRAIIANATGCSSIYGGNLPTTPWAKDARGRGPAWSNSLFEDNAEFGLGIRLSLDHQAERAHALVHRLAADLGPELVDALLQPVTGPAAADARRAHIVTLKERLAGRTDFAALDLAALADGLVPRSLWIVGGDGWAYDIDFGGLDHVLASGRNVNVLVLDTGVYSNTGGQASKATPMGAVARFAANGKKAPRKDLGRMAMSYGNVYVAQIAMGAKDAQSVKAVLEAEAWPGPSLIIAYSQCIAHGIDMTKGMGQQDLAVKTGAWPLYRFHPGRHAEGHNPLQLDSAAPSLPFADYARNESRFRLLFSGSDDAAQRLAAAEAEIADRWRALTRLAAE